MTLLTSDSLQRIRSSCSLDAVLRFLVALAGAGRILDMVWFAIWSHQVVPWPLPGSDSAWDISPVYGCDWWFAGGALLSLASYLIWAWKGPAWGFIPLLCGTFVNPEGLPLGWGLFAIQAYILWDVILGTIPNKRFLKVIRYALQGQVCWMYLSSVLGKDIDAWWVGATALEQALLGESFTTSFGNYFAQLFDGHTLKLLTRSVILLQYSAVVLLITPFMGKTGKRVQLWWSLTMILFHVGTSLFFSITMFALTCCALVALPYRQISTTIPSYRLRSVMHASAIVLLVIGLVLGSLRTRSSLAWRVGLVQNWAVMKTPEKRGHFVVEIPSWKWNSDDLGDRWKNGFGLKFFFDRRALAKWLRPACLPGEPSISWSIWHTEHERRLYGEVLCVGTH